MPAYSSNMDTRYLASNFFPLITINDVNENNNNPQVEIFAATAIKMDRQLNTQSYFQYKSQHLPAIARQVYSNTSCYWTLLWNNGLIHPLLIETGTLLNLPNIEQIRLALQVQDTNVSRIPNYKTI